MVLILTEHAMASPHVLSEVGYAFNARKRILPFRLSRVELSDELGYYLSLTQWLDAPEGCTDENLKRLTAATMDCLAGKVPGPRGQRRRRAWVFAAVAAGLAAVAGGAVYWTWSTRDAGPAFREGKTWLNPADGQTYVWIPPGTFAMGCSPGDGQCRDDEGPVRQVRIERGFWLGQTEVTIGAYRKGAKAQGVEAPEGDDNLPVTNVTWAEAKRFCGAVGSRLPTEAEWEYAARAGSSQAHYGVPREIAQYGDEARRLPHPVRTRTPNALGLYDMLGNVSEWVLDRYYNRYDPEAPATGAEVTPPLASNARAIARGGSWAGDVASLRVSRRAEMEPDTADGRVGFRCARDHS
jgi:formylglycine-generating enzyme required for sulfatase activity